MKTLIKIKNEILKSNHAAIVCHQNPDGDTLGSAFALYEALKKVGVKSDVLCSDKLPKKYAFMNEIPLINSFGAQKYDTVFFVDCATEKLAGEIIEGVDMNALNTINIDHHATNTKYADINHTDDTYSSTAELVMELIKDMDIAIDKKMAEYLYVGIVTDTGQFAYSYTSKRTHENAAYLLELGVDFSRLHKVLFNTMPLSKLMLTKTMLQKVQMHNDDKVAVSLLKMEDFLLADASQAESESLVNMLLGIEGVKAAVLIRQIDEGSFKVSFRSADDVDISIAAKSLGGGGHKQAAGATLNCNQSEVESTVLNSIANSGILK